MNRKDIKVVVTLVKHILREQHLPITYLAEALGVAATSLSDQFFFRTKVDEQLLERVLALLNIDLDLNDSVSINQALNQLGYVRTEHSSRPLKRISEAEKEERDFYSLDRFYWKLDPSRRVGKNIKALRYQLGLSREELKRKLDPRLSERMIEDWEEHGYLPSLEYCVKLSELGNLSLDKLLNKE